MKTFFVKTIIVAITFFVVFELTIGSKIRLVQDSLLKYKNKTERVKIKEKIISEIERSNNKNKILSDNDRKVISKFIIKIQEELDLKKVIYLSSYSFFLILFLSLYIFISPIRDFIISLKLTELSPLVLLTNLPGVSLILKLL